MEFGCRKSKLDNIPIYPCNALMTYLLALFIKLFFNKLKLEISFILFIKQQLFPTIIILRPSRCYEFSASWFQNPCPHFIIIICLLIRHMLSTITILRNLIKSIVLLIIYLQCIDDCKQLCTSSVRSAQQQLLQLHV